MPAHAKMACMIGVVAGAVALVDRPHTPSLAFAALATLAGWVYHLWSQYATSPAAATAPDDASDQKPAPIGGGRLETPALVALLTNGYRVPASAITATALDLAARGWVRLAVVDDELVVVTRGQGAAGDSLQPYEQQVLSHLMSRAFNDVSSAGTLAMSQHRIDRRWRTRFGHAVATHSQSLGLSVRRFEIASIAPGAVAAAAGAIALTYSITRGTDIPIADSWKSRGIALAVLIALVALAVATYDRTVTSDQKPTGLGRQRAGQWMAYRRRLRARIPSDATVLGPPQQQAALALACVMGVAEQVHDQLPVAKEDDRYAWSEAGGRPHIVRIHYPIRPGYGQHPAKVAVIGAIVLFAARWLQGFLNRLSDGKELTSMLDRVPGQVDLIEALAAVLAALCWLPLVWAAWSIVAGLVDCVATRVRIGLVARTRRPSDVVPYSNILNPFADRDRFSTYLAVDDGHRTSVVAWLATERTSAPQGAQARVRATPLLGFVRSSEPVGTATRAERALDT
jgi:hypothetical protein